MMKPAKKKSIIYFGGGTRGLPVLQAILDLIELRAIVTMPEKSRGYKPDLKEYCLTNNIMFFQPSNPNDPNFIETLKKLGEIDYLILAGYNKIVHEGILKLPDKFGINLHAGKLPEYRGSSPLNWTLINGEKIGTLSIIKLDRLVDGGDILNEFEFNIDLSLNIKDMIEIADREYPILMRKTLQNIEKIKPIQQTGVGTYYTRRTPDDGFINWELMTAEEVHNMIRALTKPLPGAFSYVRNSRVFLWKSEVLKEKIIGPVGKVCIIRDKKLIVMAKDRCILITDYEFDNESEENSKTNIKLNEYFSSSKIH